METDLSGNAEKFISEVKASAPYRKLLKEYIDYAQNFRHARNAEARRQRPKVFQKEAESFVYLTGLFIRLAME